LYLHRMYNSCGKSTVVIIPVCVCVCVTDNDTMLLVMEFVSNGCLRDYLKNNKKTTPDELLRFGLEIVEVLTHYLLIFFRFFLLLFL